MPKRRITFDGQVWRAMRLGPFVLLMALAACSPPPVEFSNKLTIKELVAACGKDQLSERAPNCDLVFAQYLGVFADAGGPTEITDPKVCFPNDNDFLKRDAFRIHVIEWAKKHPEMQSRTIVDAMLPMVTGGAFHCSRH